MAAAPESARALTRALRVAVCVTFLLAGAAPVDAQSEPRAQAQARGEAANAALLERWNRLTDEERARYRERFEEYQQKDPEERAVMQERAKHLDAMARSLYGTLSDEERERLAEMTPAKRREILHEMLADEARDVGRRIRESLPPRMRERFDAARPEDRERFIASVRSRLSKQMVVVFERLGRELGIPPPRIQRLNGLPESERRSEFLALLKQRFSQDLGETGLPAGISQDAWLRLQELPPREFFHAILRLRESHPEIGLRRGGGPRPEPADPRLRRARAAMGQALQRGTPAERLELARLSGREREAELTRRRRARVLAVIRSEGLLSEEEIRALARQPDPIFFRDVRALVGGQAPGREPGARKPAPGARGPGAGARR